MMRLINLFLKYCFIVFAIFHGSWVAAADPDLKFQHIQEGLNSSQIVAIVQTIDGYIWVGTASGLHKYDGLQFELYLHNEDPSSLRGNYITSLFEDSSGNLWVGTADGICRYNREQNNFERFETKTPGNEDNPFLNRLRSIVEDKNGNLWAASERGGLFLFSQAKQHFNAFPLYDQFDSSHTVRISTLEVDNDNVLWVGSFEQGVFAIDLNTNEIRQFREFDTNRGIYSIGLVWDIESGKDGTVWLGTKVSGLFKITKHRGLSMSVKRYAFDSEDAFSLSNNDINAILLDSNGKLWIGNENGGLHLYNRIKDNFIRYTSSPANEYSLSHSSIWCIFEDRQERLWVGGAFKGINLYDKLYSKFSHYRQSINNPSGLSHNVIRDFLEDEKGNVWIATDGGGLNYFDRRADTFEHFQYDHSNSNSIRSNAVLGLCRSSDNKLWAGTWAGGINVLHDEEQKIFKGVDVRKATDYAQEDHYFNIIRDRDGNMWAANFGRGLAKYDFETKDFKIYKSDPNDDQSLSASIVVSLLIDSQGTIWAGTDGYGINKMYINQDGKVKFKRIIPPNTETESKPSNIINQLFEDSNGYIWAATENGLHKLNRDHTEITIYSERHGLPSVSIKSIVEDEKGYLWLGTVNGIAQFDPNTLTARNFNSNDGLQGNEFSRYAAEKLSTGEILFGGINGFNLFHPDSVVYNTHPPEVYITDIKIFNKEIEIGGEDSPLQKHISVTKDITITHKQNVFSLQFTALNYTRSENNQFAFKLDGLEDEWNYVGTQRKASYSNLSPGKYTFKVKASNNDGVWNEKGAELHITVLPPWWNTWWAKSVIALFALIIVYLIVKARTNYINRQRKMLKELVSERTRELKLKNERIESQAKELLDYNDSLNSLNDDLNRANENLEKTVESRTQQLKKKNKKLAEYAFINAHNLRVPVANIKGLIQLFDKKRTEEEILELIDLMRGQSKNMDRVLTDIQRMLERDELLNNKDQLEQIERRKT